VARQLSLLAPSDLPEGLSYQDDFVSPDCERELVARIADLPLKPFQFGAYEGHRRVASFGWRYDYTAQKLEPASAPPEWLDPVTAQVEAFGALPAGGIRQVLFTEYAPGVGIGWHRDKRAFDVVLGLSLGSECGLRFRRKAGDRWQRYTLTAAPRSLYRMSGPARHQWEHSIASVEHLRYSITFRTLTAG
jgi:alkylated DNA repair dioxygenase AlkB